MSETKYVTPEYLLSHGFVQYKDGYHKDVPFDAPFYDEHAFHFMEKQFHRQMFVVILWPDDDETGEYDHVIYVQHDAGCGFVQIPEAWAQLPIEYLEAIYYGIRGEKLSKIPDRTTVVSIQTNKGQRQFANINTSKDV